MDHSIANNVKQQKGSFSMPGKRKWKGVMGLHSAGEV